MRSKRHQILASNFLHGTGDQPRFRDVLAEIATHRSNFRSRQARSSARRHRAVSVQPEETDPPPLTFSLPHKRRSPPKESLDVRASSCPPILTTALTAASHGPPTPSPRKFFFASSPVPGLSSPPSSGQTLPPSPNPTIQRGPDFEGDGCNKGDGDELHEAADWSNRADILWETTKTRRVRLVKERRRVRVLVAPSSAVSDLMEWANEWKRDCMRLESQNLNEALLNAMDSGKGLWDAGDVGGSGDLRGSEAGR